MHAAGTLFESAANFNAPTRRNPILGKTKLSDSLSQPLIQSQCADAVDGQMILSVGKRDLNAP